jgi:Tfp pilus assembly protein PilX
MKQDAVMTKRTPNNEQGVALILTLFLMMALSVIGASLMLLSQTETYSSQNYRLMSQARYGAESGIQRTVNFLAYPASYVAPSAGGADPLADYDMTKSPVTCAAGACTAGQPIVLSANPAVTANYPILAVQTAFNNAMNGTLTAGSTSGAVSYLTSALLLSMRRVNVYGGGIQTIQTWQITSDGSVTATRTATVEVTSVMETPVMPATMYGAFGTDPGCGALKFKGTSNVDSYDSTAALVGGNPVISASGGNVGTNGNMTESGNATINGTLSTPRVGVGACSDGNVDALSSSGSAAICPNPALSCSSGVQPGGVVNLPSAIVLPAPTPPNPLPPTTAFSGNDQTLLNGASVGDITITGNKTLTLGAVGTTSIININSLKITSGNIVILGHVILNVAGTGLSGGTVLDFSGGSVTNPGFNPSTFEIQYAGTGQISANGNSAAAEMIYAPNAAVTLNGTGDVYGSLVGKTIVNNGNADIHYDRHLSGQFFVVGNGMMSAFSWKKY